MAQSGYEAPRDSLDDEVPGAKVGSETASQGQNVQGMLAVLVVGIVMVVGAYVVLLGLQSRPASDIEPSYKDAVAATQQSEPATKPVPGN